MIAVASVVWQADPKTLDTFCDNAETEVAALSDKSPGLLAPFVRFFDKEVGGHTGVDRAAFLHFITAVTSSLDGGALKVDVFVTILLSLSYIASLRNI